MSPAKTPRALCGLALLLASCAATGPRDLAPIGVLEFRFVEPVASAEGPVETFTYRESELPLGPAHHFGLTELGLTSDGLGRPALLLEVAERDRAALLEVTEAGVGRNVATVVDGKVVSVAQVIAPLSGSVQIEGDFDLADIEAMIAAITGNQPPD